MKQVKISIRGMIEFIYREGDIDSSMKSAVTMQEGTRIHQMIQEKYEGFKKEVSLKAHVPITKEVELLLAGRADGIYDDGEMVIIDEIKSTYQDVDKIEESLSFLHWAQAKLYGAIYTKDLDMAHVHVQLTYYSLKDEAEKKFLKKFTHAALQAFFDDTIEAYKKWASLKSHLQLVAETSAHEMTFPFEGFRAGQKLMAQAVYQTIREGDHLIAEAPTGIGKTISTLFPAVKALGNGIVSKVFYLTSKTVHRAVAMSTYQLLRQKGYQGMVLSLQAKEKMCINDVFKCDPLYCPYAKGHFDRVNDALYDILQDVTLIEPQDVQKWGLDYVLCPFELALDLTDFAQGVVCDYNYFFDPFVQIKRHFLIKNAYTVLVDEAHNLHERARDMYSAELDLDEFLNVRKKIKTIDPGYQKALTKVIASIRKHLKTQNTLGLLETIPLSLINTMTQAVSYFLDEGRFSEIMKDDDATENFFHMNRFIKMYEYYDDHFVAMVDQMSPNVLKMRCLDPSEALKETYEMVNNVVCFSATLSPLKFYQSVLGHQTSKRLQLGSPFDTKNRVLMIQAMHSTYAKDRPFTLPFIASDIERVIRLKTANYFVFCPSYAYMHQLHEALLEISDATLLTQTPDMKESERADFINRFTPNPQTTHVGLVVLGGVFSEGIDLHGDQLSGVFVVGVGLPTMDAERQIIRDYYESIGLNGFEYACMFPGLNRVFQAGGRLIRTETDKGFLMLIGKRFGQERYLRELPNHWMPYELVENELGFEHAIKKIQDILE